MKKLKVLVGLILFCFAIISWDWGRSIVVKVIEACGSWEVFLQYGWTTDLQLALLTWIGLGFMQLVLGCMLIFGDKKEKQK